MSSTLLRSMKAYKCPGERDMIYTLITNTAESNLHPIRYSHWPIVTGTKFDLIRTICRMAGDVYSGSLKWRSDEWGRDGSSSEFVIYGEKMMKQAVETADPVPELDHFNVIYFKDDDPCADIWANFESIAGYRICNFLGEKVLQIENPAVLDLYMASQVQAHHKSCLNYAMTSKQPDIAKLRKDLSSCSFMFPEQFRNAFKGLEVPQ